MKSVAFIASCVVVLLSCCGCNDQAAVRPAARAAAPPPTVEDLIAVLGSPDATVQQRIDAESCLNALPAEGVLMALMPEMTKELERGGVYNGYGNAQGDQALPLEWRARESYYRVWHGVSPRDPQLTARCLTAFLKAATTQAEKSFAAYQLRFFWADEAEQDVADLLCDVDGHLAWHPSLECLLTHKRDKYYEQARQLTARLPASNGEEILFKSRAIHELLAEPLRQTRRSGGFITYDIDHELVVMGFELVQTMKSRGQEVDSFLIHDLCAYLGRPFQPDEHDLVDRATAWWCENRDRYRAKR